MLERVDLHPWTPANRALDVGQLGLHLGPLAGDRRHPHLAVPDSPGRLSPSLHVGWNLLIGLAVYRTGAGRRARMFGLVSPMAMVAAVILTGNHYAIDAVLGAMVALAGLAVAWRLNPLPTSDSEPLRAEPVWEPTSRPPHELVVMRSKVSA